MSCSTQAELIYSEIQKAQLSAHAEISLNIKTVDSVKSKKNDLRELITPQETNEKCHYFSYFLENYINSDPSKIPFDTSVLTDKARSIMHLSKKEPIPDCFDRLNMSNLILNIISNKFKGQEELLSIIAFSTCPSLFSFFKIKSVFELFIDFISELYDHSNSYLIYNTKLYLLFCQPLFISPLVINFTIKVFRPIFHSFFEDPFKYQIREYLILNPNYANNARKQILQNVQKNLCNIPYYLSLFLTKMKNSNEIIRDCYFSMIINNPKLYQIVDFWISKDSSKFKMIQSLLRKVLINDSFIDSFTQLLIGHDDRHTLNFFINESNITDQNEDIKLITMIDNVDISIFSSVEKLLSNHSNKQFSLNKLVDQYNVFEGRYETQLQEMLMKYATQSSTDASNSYDCLRKLLRYAPLLPSKAPDDINGTKSIEIFSNIVEKYLLDISDPFTYAKQQLYYKLLLRDTTDYFAVSKKIEKLCKKESNQIKEINNLCQDYFGYYSSIYELLKDFKAQFISELVMKTLSEINMPLSIKDMINPIELNKQFNGIYESFPVKPGSQRSAITSERFIFPYEFFANLTFSKFRCLRQDLSFHDNFINKFINDHYHHILKFAFQQSEPKIAEDYKLIEKCLLNFGSYIRDFRSIIKSDFDPFSMSKYCSEVITKVGDEFKSIFGNMEASELTNLICVFLTYANLPYLVSIFIFLLDYMKLPFYRYNMGDMPFTHQLSTYFAFLRSFSNEIPYSYFYLSRLVFYQFNIYLLADETCQHTPKIYMYTFSQLNSLISKKKQENDLKIITDQIVSTQKLRPVQFDEIKHPDYMIRLVLHCEKLSLSNNSNSFNFMSTQENIINFVLLVTDNTFLKISNAKTFLGNNVQANYKNVVTIDNIKNTKKQEMFNNINFLFHNKIQQLLDNSSIYS